MIRRLRWKFIALNMALIAAILLAVGLVLVSSTRDNLRNNSLAVLQRVIRETELNGPTLQFSGSGVTLTPADTASPRNPDIQQPYFTAQVTETGVVSLVADHYFDTVDEDWLLDVVGQTLRAPADSGTLPDAALRYLRMNTGHGWRLAYTDLAQENHTVSALIRNIAAIFSGALALVFGVNLLFSHWAVAPVEKSWRQQRQFVADASHELKTPLAVILSNLDMLERYGEQTPEKRPRWMENIRVSSTQMKTLVEEMLTLARSDSAVQSTVQAPLDLSDLVESDLLLFEPAAFEAGKTIRDEIEPGLTVLGDAGRLKQLLGILLDNACKYSPAGAELSVTLRGEGKRAVLSVFNPGDPIPPEALGRIFERFYRLDPSRTEAGYGLGLSIARQIAQEHHGRLWAASDEGGNTFTLSLPRSH